MHILCLTNVIIKKCENRNRKVFNGPPSCCQHWRIMILLRIKIDFFIDRVKRFWISIKCRTIFGKIVSLSKKCNAGGHIFLIVHPKIFRIVDNTISSIFMKKAKFKNVSIRLIFQNYTRVENSNERLKCQIAGPKLLKWVNKILFRTFHPLPPTNFKLVYSL